MDNALIQYFSQYELIVLFVGSIIFGETVIVPAILLSAQGVLSPMGVFIASFFGTVISDIGWFILGKRGIDFLARFSSRVRKRYTSYIEQVEKRSEYRRLIFFIFFKFVYGFRILTIIYFSLHRMPFARFLAITSLGTVIWLSAAFLIGYPAWKGLANIVPSWETISWMHILAIITIAVLFRIIIQWIGKRIIKT